MIIGTTLIPKEQEQFYKEQLDRFKEFVPKDLLEWFLELNYLFDNRGYSLIGANCLEQAVRDSLDHSIDWEEREIEDGFYPATALSIDDCWNELQNGEKELNNLLWFKRAYDQAFKK